MSITKNGYYVKYNTAELLALPHSKIDTKSKGSYQSACPFCREGHRRFVFFLNEGNYFCYICGVKGWVTDQPANDNFDWQTIETERADRQIKQADRHKEIIADLERRHVAERYHENLTTDHRKYLHTHYGLEEFAVNGLKIGYCPRCPLSPTSDSLTIPYYWQNGRLRLINLRHRLLKPPLKNNGQPDGKYRPEQSGLLSTIYNIDLLLSKDEETIILVEGEIKAAVLLYQFGIPAVGIPGAGCFKPEWAKYFADKRVYVALDPDVESYQLSNVTDKLSPAAGQVLITELPFKPDDMLVHYGYTVGQFCQIIEMSRPL